MIDLLLIVIIFAGAAFVSSMAGFGAALVAMPLLTLRLDLTTAAPLFALVGGTLAATIAIRSRQQMIFASVWRLLLTTFVGIPVGALGMKQLPGDWVVRCLGVLLIGFGIYRLGNFQLPTLKSPLWAFPFGLVGGVLAGAYNTSGPPAVIYASMNRWSPPQFRATLQSYFMATSLGIVLTHGLTGLWTPQIFQLYVVALPGTLLMIRLGERVNQHISVDRFQALVSALLIVLGILLWF